MQIPWKLPVKLSVYAKDRYSVLYPVISKCPCCNASVRLRRHGFYKRNVLVKNKCFRIDICRYRCPSCLKTISLLPHFLLPYFQHTRDTILQSLRARFQKLSFSLCRQLTAYYHKRFLNNLPAIISVLRELGWREKLPDDFNKRAIKLVERLELTPPRDLTSPEVNLSNRILANFMASSF